MKKPQFSWDPKDGAALCIIYDKNNVYYGTAKCHPEDTDMMSEKTGCEIAYMRAILQSLKKQRDELKCELKGLKKYYYSINQSKHFNKDSYEVRLLISHIKLITEDISILKELIKIQRERLNDFLKNKSTFYQKIRKNRMDKKK